jgi:hypothetical protein
MAVEVAVGVGVTVGVFVGSGVAVSVGVAVEVIVDVGIAVEVPVEVAVSVGVNVGVNPSVSLSTALKAELMTGVAVRVSVGTTASETTGWGTDVPRLQAPTPIALRMINIAIISPRFLVISLNQPLSRPHVMQRYGNSKVQTCAYRTGSHHFAESLCQGDIGPLPGAMVKIQPRQAELPQHLDDTPQMSFVGLKQMGSPGHGSDVHAKSATHMEQGIEQPSMTAAAEHHQTSPRLQD